jgi:hypothetical protein
MRLTRRGRLPRSPRLPTIPACGRTRGSGGVGRQWNCPSEDQNCSGRR